MKYSELEKQIREEKDIFKKHELIMQITENDDVAGNLARKVLKKDIDNMLEKIWGIYQRESAEIRDITNVSKIRQLIDWLENICED